MVDSIKRGESELQLPGAVTIPGFYSEGKIYIVRGHELDRQLVKHEMLHAMGFRHWHAILWACSQQKASVPSNGKGGDG